MATGKVYLVGAGPGDPGLITLRAVQVLQRADAVLYDYLANPAILAHCRPDAHLISLGKHGSGRVLTQAEINERLVELAQLYPAVVRLKSGDPMIFGRAAEELDHLLRHGIAFEIVPGVTTALAAGGYAGIPITQRETASAVAFVTGQEGEEKEGATLDYGALAQFPGTLVFYMGVTTAAQWSQALIAAGKSAATPVAVVRHVSLPDQKRIDTTLGDVAKVIQQVKLRPPVVFIVGEVAAHGAAWSWFDKRPLFGQRILVTRPAQQAADLARPLAELGAEVLLQPAIAIYPPGLRSKVEAPLVEKIARLYPSHGDWSKVDRVLDLLDRFDWLVFSSANGVRYFLDRLWGRLGPLGPDASNGIASCDLRALGKIEIAAIGPGTAEELARYHLRADLIPNEFRAESLALALKGAAAGKKFLLIRASRGREVLGEELARAGGSVEQVVVYESVDVETPAPEIAERMAAGQIDWTTVTSSAIATSVARLFGAALKKTRLASISPITSATLRQLGFEPAAEAKHYTMSGVVEAILKASPPAGG